MNYKMKSLLRRIVKEGGIDADFLSDADTNRAELLVEKGICYKVGGSWSGTSTYMVYDKEAFDSKIPTKVNEVKKLKKQYQVFYKEPYGSGRELHIGTADSEKEASSLARYDRVNKRRLKSRYFWRLEGKCL